LPNEEGSERKEVRDHDICGGRGKKSQYYTLKEEKTGQKQSGESSGKCEGGDSKHKPFYQQKSKTEKKGRGDRGLKRISNPGSKKG